MEAVLSASDNSPPLIGPLSYGLDPQGSYITNRRSSTTFSNVNSASPIGVKTITINCGSSSEWLDCESCVLSMLITNSGAQPLRAATVGAHCLFDTLIVRMGSTEIERIDQFGKVTEILTKLSYSSQKRIEMGMLGFGTQAFGASDSHTDASYIPTFIAAGETKRIYMKFSISALFSQHRWCPLFALGGQGLSIQLQLAPAAQAVIASDGATNYSQTYALSDIKLLGDMMSLDGQLQESYTSAMLSGSSLKMPVKCFEVLKAYLPADSNGSFDLPLSKNYTRLASLYAVFNRAEVAAGTAQIVNTNYCPVSAKEGLRYHLALGSKRLPDNDVEGTSQAFWRLQSSLGLWNSLAHSGSISEADYNSTCFAIGIDCEKIAGSGLMASGENLSTGQTIFLKVKGMGTNAATVPRSATIFAFHERIISISDTVVDVFD